MHKFVYFAAKPENSSPRVAVTGLLWLTAISLWTL